MQLNTTKMGKPMDCWLMNLMARLRAEYSLIVMYRKSPKARDKRERLQQENNRDNTVVTSNACDHELSEHCNEPRKQIYLRRGSHKAEMDATRLASA